MGAPDWRSWEWSYLWRLTHLEKEVFVGHELPVVSLADSDEGKSLLSGDETSSQRSPGEEGLGGIASALGSVAILRWARGRAARIVGLGSSGVNSSEIGAPRPPSPTGSRGRMARPPGARGT